jgi:hypothetical protein
MEPVFTTATAILSHINPVLTLPPYFYKINFIIIPIYSEIFLLIFILLVFLPELRKHFSPMHAICLTDVIILMIFGRGRVAYHSPPTSAELKIRGFMHSLPHTFSWRSA